MAPVTLGELQEVFHWFKKDKIPRPDGWPFKFFLEFYDLIGSDILTVVEECRTLGKIYDAFNATFRALIPKEENPHTFDDYRPISLCTNIYNIIAKIISNRLRPILSNHISKEQFVLLDN